jgi:hypothetical protein
MFIPDPNLSIPDPEIKKIPDPRYGPASKNLNILTQTIVSQLSENMIRDVHPDRIRILTFYPSQIPAPGVKKAPDPGSEFATMHRSTRNFRDEPVFLDVFLPSGWPSLLFGSLLLRRSSSKTVKSIVSPEAAFTESAILNHKAWLYLMPLF